MRQSPSNSLVCYSSPSLFQAANDFAEPFTRFFDRFYLEPFGPEEVKRFIEIPLKKTNSDYKIEDSAIEQLYTLTQGHPFFLSFSMFDLLTLIEDQKTKQVTKTMVDKYFPQVFQHLALEKFEADFSKASDNEKKILQQMAAITEAEISPTQLKVKQSGKYLKNLVENKGLVVKTSRGRYQLYHPLFKEYIKKL